jgi:hypothetical protein
MKGEKEGVRGEKGKQEGERTGKGKEGVEFKLQRDFTKLPLLLYRAQGCTFKG